jgi:hypothetical protein
MPPKKPRVPPTREVLLKRALERRERARLRQLVRRAHQVENRNRQDAINATLANVQAQGGIAARETARRARQAFNAGLEYAPVVARGVAAVPGAAADLINRTGRATIEAIQGADKIAKAAHDFVAGEVVALRDGVRHVVRGVAELRESDAARGIDQMIQASFMPYDMANRAIQPVLRRIGTAAMGGIEPRLRQEQEMRLGEAQEAAQEVAGQASAQQQAAGGLGAYAQARALMQRYMGGVAAAPAPPPVPPPPPPPPPASGALPPS